MAKLSVRKKIHIIIHRDLRKAYVVPVFTRSGGIYFEMTPVSCVQFLHDMEEDQAALCRAIADTIAHSEGLMTTPPVNELSRRWNGDHEAAWIYASFLIDIEWTDQYIHIDECEPVIVDHYHLPSMEPVARGKFSLSTTVGEIAEYILNEFVYTDCNEEK